VTWRCVPWVPGFSPVERGQRRIDAASERPAAVSKRAEVRHL
jgi:hypothetical protein